MSPFRRLGGGSTRKGDRVGVVPSVLSLVNKEGGVWLDDDLVAIGEMAIGPAQ